MSVATGWDRKLRGRLLVLGLALFVYLTAEMFPVGALPEIAAGLDLRQSTAGLLLSGYAIAAGLAAIPVVVWLSGRDRRTVLVGSMILLAVSQVALAAAPTFEAAMLSRVVAAVAHGYVWAVVPVAAASLAPDGAKGRATAAVFVGSAAGLVIGSPVSAALSQAFGWRAAAAVLAISAGVVAVLIRRVLPRLPGRPSGSVASRSSAQALPWRRLGAICGITAMVAIAHYVSYTYFALLVEPVGITGSRYAVLLAAYGVAGLVGVRLVGRYIDRFNRGTGVVLFVVFAVSLAGLGPALMGGAAVVAVVLVLLWAASFSAAPAVLQDTVLRIAPDHGDTASAVYVVGFSLGIAIGSAAGAAALGPLSAAELPVLSAALAVAALALVIRGVRPPARVT
ncbi:MFS transporter [Rhodococcus sp. H29-C3]|uniref:MFS transporter n=1 Tax=Rhodococcus sp. H29-C3 TaxID=3046307 RepID=UPI0024B8AA42|nr:MFS transporter [Rhodococcus sp. H29-C3]MDJ0362493.1 MFS transporter [Rhodococcus sp. H29-C3]